MIHSQSDYEYELGEKMYSVLIHVKPSDLFM